MIYLKFIHFNLTSLIVCFCDGLLAFGSYCENIKMVNILSVRFLSENWLLYSAMRQKYLQAFVLLLCG